MAYYDTTADGSEMVARYFCCFAILNTTVCDLRFILTDAAIRVAVAYITMSRCLLLLSSSELQNC